MNFSKNNVQTKKIKIRRVLPNQTKKINKINKTSNQRFPVQQIFSLNSQLKENVYSSNKPYDLTNDKIPASKSVESKSYPSSIIDPTKMISLKLKSNYKTVSAKDYKQNSSNIPLLVTIETKDIEDENEDFRQGLDLVLVIDISGSMQGNKIKLVRETLISVSYTHLTLPTICSV